MKLIPPASLVWFLITGLVYMAQLFPITGVALMIFGAPFWSVLTVNLGMLGIAAEAFLLRWVSKVWLIVPALWFGGYAGCYAFDHVTSRQAVAAITRLDPEDAIPFDPATADVLIEGSESHGAAASLMTRFDLPVAYSAPPLSHWGMPADLPQTIAHRIAPLGRCDFQDESMLQTFGVTKEQQVVDNQLNGYCQFTVPERPRRAAVVVTPSASETRLREIATRRRLAPFPMPVLGCGLNSGAHAWQCETTFWRSADSEQLAPAVADPAARLGLRLGLKPRRGLPTQPDPADDPAVAIEAAAAHSEDLIRRTMADPTIRVPWSIAAQKLLRDRPEIVARHSAAIMRTLDRHWSDPDAWPGLAFLIGLLPSLPDSDFERLRPRLVALTQRGEPDSVDARRASQLDGYVGERLRGPKADDLR